MPLAFIFISHRRLLFNIVRKNKILVHTFIHTLGFIQCSRVIIGLSLAPEDIPAPYTINQCVNRRSEFDIDPTLD